MVSAKRSFVGLVAAYVVGSLGACLLSYWVGSVDLRLIHFIPWIFLMIPIVGILICKKRKLLKKTYKFRDGAIGMLALSFLTWLFVVYLYLTNMFPEVF